MDKTTIKTVYIKAMIEGALSAGREQLERGEWNNTEKEYIRGRVEAFESLLEDIDKMELLYGE